MSEPHPQSPPTETEPLGKAQKLEFRLKVLQQFTNLSIAGVGLALTLIGTVFDRTAIISWIPVGMFLGAAMLAMVGQLQVSVLAESDRATLPRNTAWIGAIAYFLGAGIASLCFVVFKSTGVSG